MPEFFEKVKKRLKKKLQTACGMCRDAAARMKKGRKPKLPAFLNLGGRGGIRTLDTEFPYAAFPGRYNQPLCHPSMMCSAVSCSAVVKALLQVGQVPETEKQEYTKERKVCHE